MKVIFLDFDGVLNTEKYVLLCGRFGVIIEDEKMELLAQIVRRTGAEIVLSSSWREHWAHTADGCDETGDEINAIFRCFGLRIYDKTPELSYRREREIEKWISDFSPEQYVVIDDLPLDCSGAIGGHFVKTSGYSTALTQEGVELAVEILNK